MSSEGAHTFKELDEELDGSCQYDRVLDRKTTFISRARISAPAEPLGLDGSFGTAKKEASTLDLDRASGWSDDMSGLGHLDPQRSIILRFECMSAAELKVTLLALYALLFLGLFSLIGLIIVRILMREDSTWLGSDIFSKASAGMATICLCPLLMTLTWGFCRIGSAWRSGKHWGERRKRLVTMALVQAIAQTVNVTFWLTPHVHILLTRCGWFDDIVMASGAIQWTMWNTIFLTLTVSAHNSNPWLHKGKPVPTQPDPLILDAPLWYHAPKLLLWCAFQGTIISDAVMESQGDYTFACDSRKWEGACDAPLHSKIFSVVWGALSLGYFVVYVFYNTRARMRLEKLPYNRFRTGNLLQNWQRRQGKWIMNFMVGSVLASWYFSWTKCSSYFTTWLGIAPLEVVVTGSMVATLLFMLPMPASKAHPGVQTLLQGFSWSEATRMDDLAQRNLQLGSHVKDVKMQPMFCLETAVKLLTFSWVVYDDTTPPAAEKELHINIPHPDSQNFKQTAQVDEAKLFLQGDREHAYKGGTCSASRDSHKAAEPAELTREELLSTALSFYDLQNTYIIHEKDPDTKVLISWSHDTIVVAFRGTASMKNVLHDLQAWRAEHVPKRGHFWLGRRPLVHKGFWHSWSAHGVGDRVMDFIGNLLTNSKLPAADWHVYITGHSLGGALATLAAYDIQTAFGFKDLQVYTYGAPRTGNHAFAREYEALIPETWHVVHDSDVIPRVGKFVRMYKRPGARVIIDRKGSIVVRPSALELHLRPTCRSLKAHYLKSYRSALGGLLRAQFCPLKAFVGGRRAALSLADSPRVSSYLCSTGLDLVALSESDSSLGDATDSDAASVTSDEVPSRMPVWAHALVDQVVGTSLESNIARAAHLTRQPGDDPDLVTGSIQDSTRGLQP